MTSVQPFDTTWCMAKHKNNYDSFEVWRLKLAFMEKHKSTIREDELVCLAQTMINIELLGCQYPVSLKNKVVHLGGDLLVQFRDRRMKRNKRTFVSASDAAQSFVRRECGEWDEAM